MKIDLVMTATTPDERAKGLSAVKPLELNEGALFVFPNEVKTHFWNKGVSYPIDIAFFNEQGKLVHLDSLGPEQLHTITSPKFYKFVVETRKGWFANNVGELISNKELTLSNIL